MHTITWQNGIRLTAMIAVAVLWLTTAPTTAIFWTLFIVFASFDLDPKPIGIGALALLVLIPVTLSIERLTWLSEPLAVYVFFLLTIVVGLQMLALLRSPAEVDEPEETHALYNTSVSQPFLDEMVISEPSAPPVFPKQLAKKVTKPRRSQATIASDADIFVPKAASKPSLKTKLKLSKNNKKTDQAPGQIHDEMLDLRTGVRPFRE